jgi:hypothetical protein
MHGGFPPQLELWKGFHNSIIVRIPGLSIDIVGCAELALPVDFTDLLVLIKD